MGFKADLLFLKENYREPKVIISLAVLALGTSAGMCAEAKWRPGQDRDQKSPAVQVVHEDVPATSDHNPPMVTGG